MDFDTYSLCPSKWARPIRDRNNVTPKSAHYHPNVLKPETSPGSPFRSRVNVPLCAVLITMVITTAKMYC